MLLKAYLDVFHCYAFQCLVKTPFTWCQMLYLNSSFSKYGDKEYSHYPKLPLFLEATTSPSLLSQFPEATIYLICHVFLYSRILFHVCFSCRIFHLLNHPCCRIAQWFFSIFIADKTSVVEQI